MKIGKEWAEQLLAIRDALVDGDCDEAYHQLYQLAERGRNTFEPWDEWEIQAKHNRIDYLTTCAKQSKIAERNGRKRKSL